MTGLTSGVAQISGGWYHTCAVTTAGGSKCWGYNYYGGLGNGTFTTLPPYGSATPADVTGLTSGVAQISGGAYHTCAVTTAGAAKCWGYNWYGALGNGTFTTSPPYGSATPADVTGLTSGVAQISGGAFHTCAVTTAGAARCWGFNYEGEVGNGTFSTSPPYGFSTPINVAGLTSGVAALWDGEAAVTDAEAPAASPIQSPAANASGWNSSDVTVTWQWTDTGGSGIDAANCTTSSTSAGEGNPIGLNATCKDLAGNQGSASYNVKVDKTAPTISAAATTAPNGNAWYNADVSVAFTCNDSLSGVATCPAAQTLTGEGAAVASTAGTATDNAGNASTPSNVVTVSIDRTLPLVALVGGPANGGSYYFGTVPAAPTCSASDALSGLDGACTVSGYSTALGSHVVTATAKDRAGHQQTASSTYTVLPWTFSGFYQPVDIGGVWNTVKGGSTVPIKFEVFAGSTELTDTLIVVQPLTAAQSSCSGGLTDAIELQASGSTSLRYDTVEGQFIYNWKTPRMPGYCYIVTVTLADGTSRSANFQLR